MSEVDLTLPEGVLTFLEGTPFSSDNVVKLTGGLGNYVFRLHLKTPYHEHTTLVLKHGKPHLPGDETFTFDLERQAFEVGVLKRIREWLPDDSLVTVPAIHHFDEVANIIIMDDCGGVGTLKQLMIDNPPPLVMAQQIGEALGKWLACLHSWGSSDKDALAYVNGNQQARSIAAFVTYGRLVSTLKGENAPPSMTDPVLDIPAGHIATVEKVVQEMTQEIMTTEETLVMGDFWPGNIIVVFSDDRSAVQRLYVLDWEIVRPGIAGLDVGQFLAEMHLLRSFRPHCAESSTAVISSFQTAYAKTRGGPMELVAKKAMIHVGAHLVAWTPLAGWGGKEKTREVVLHGVGYLVGDASKEETHAIVGNLTSR
ncbi:kinase-like domain-containing protein [Cristinia sonorae]|uniref:Kinase-like domain-containing protein n=1 Tax=Cristinia sonorae TaxID=1940300 RepID=A0A8K0XNR1_9AGAR|nr:kinase-like domain-containing protein [Cristinia sonorae]